MQARWLRLTVREWFSIGREGEYERARFEGSHLAITYAIRDILSFIDVQDYNTPPLEGLDGEIYQPGPVDYHAAMTELLLRGFNVGGNPRQFFRANAGR